MWYLPLQPLISVIGMSFTSLSCFFGGTEHPYAICSSCLVRSLRFMRFFTPSCGSLCLVRLLHLRAVLCALVGSLVYNCIHFLQYIMDADPHNTPSLYVLADDSCDDETNNTISVAKLNWGYAFKGIYLNLGTIPEHDKFDHSVRLVLLNSEPVAHIVESFSYFTNNDLIRIAHAHNIPAIKGIHKFDLQHRLLQHTCSMCPEQIVYIFKSLTRDRRLKLNAQKSPTVLSTEEQLKDRKLYKLQSQRVSRQVLTEKVAGKCRAQDAVAHRTF